MRSRGYYEARANQNASISEDGSVFLFLNLELGPMVRLVFEGDPLPTGEVDRLVPVRREASVDEDLLEDSQSMIESYLHAQGYRDAMAMYTREERAGELIITFRITRGPRYLVRSVMLTGNFVLATPQLLPLVRLKEGEPFVRSTLAMGVSAIENLYRVSGFTRPQMKATESVVAPEDPARPGPARQRDDHDCRGPTHRSPVGHLPGQQDVGRCGAAQAHLDGARAGVFDRRCRLRSRRDRAGVSRPRLRKRRGHAADDVRRKDTRADVRFTIVEGPQIIVDHIIIAGNRHISTETIEREIAVRPGEPYGEAAVVQSRINLNRLELFRRVQIEALGHSGETRRDVLVQVEESASTTVDLSGGVEGGYFVQADRGGRSRRGSVRSHAAWIDSGDAAQSLGQEPDDYAVHAREPAHARRAGRARFSSTRRRRLKAATGFTSTARSRRTGSRVCSARRPRFS